MSKRSRQIAGQVVRSLKADRLDDTATVISNLEKLGWDEVRSMNRDTVMGQRGALDVIVIFDMRRGGIKEIWVEHTLSGKAKKIRAIMSPSRAAKLLGG